MTPAPRFKTMAEWNTPDGRLQGVCDVLNGIKDTDRGKVAVRLVSEWMAARTLDAFLHSHLDVWGDLWTSVEWGFLPRAGRKWGDYRPSPRHPADMQDENQIATWLLANLVTNPLCEKLAGPCARCGRYYIKKRASQKVYCSRRCGNAATALARTRERIKAERDDKLRRAKTAIREWRSAKTQQDWKHWVAKRASVDLRFLTRAVTKHDIVPPTKGR